MGEDLKDLTRRTAEMLFDPRESFRLAANRLNDKDGSGWLDHSNISRSSI
jgi:hypothetical protein